MNYDFSKGFAGFGMPAAPFQSFFADAGDRGQDAVRRSQKAVQEFADLSRDNVDAVVEAGKIAVEGARSIGQDVVESGREGVERVGDAVRALAEAKSPTEFIELQSEFARAAFDRMVGETSRLTESVVKLTGEAFQPLSSRASTNAERINKFVA
jgi:phasin family protein